MQRFAALLDRLMLTPRRADKTRLLVEHFRQTPDPERGWALAAAAGELAFRAAKPAALRALAATRIDPVLFALSEDFVGDLAETIALAWTPKPGANRPPSLPEIVLALNGADKTQTPALIERWLDALDADGRWALLKLATGGVRVGVTARLARQALAEFGAAPVEEIEAMWSGLAPPYEDLFAWLEGAAAKPAPVIRAPFRPVMLAGALGENAQGITPDAYAAEWKWDGARVQAVCEDGARRLYTRAGDDLSHAFPDVIAGLDFEGAVDGELLIAGKDGGPAPFAELQRRLDRKSITAKQAAARPAYIRAFDLLAENGEDLRGRPFRARRSLLERLIAAHPGDRLRLSELLPFAHLDDLEARRAAPPSPQIEGVMLKRWDAPYLAGRPQGLWLKWRRDPFLLDAVLMYAQRGEGRRSAYFSDFTFGLWRGAGAARELVPVGKSGDGLSEAELKELDRFVRHNATERFGPARAVRADAEAGVVLEIAFEGVERSARRKSGLALRFACIRRIRWDKPPAEADDLDRLAALLPDDAP